MSGLTLGARRLRWKWMGTPTPTFRARPVISVLSLLLVPLFAYANFLCVAGEASDCDSQDVSEAQTTHHQESPTHQHNDCSHDSCFCLTMNTVGTQQTIVKPAPILSFHSFDFALTQVQSAIPMIAAMTFEHGPPGTSPPAFLSVSPVSPRSPPYLA